MGRHIAIDRGTRERLGEWYKRAQDRYRVLTTTASQRDIIKAARAFTKPSRHGRMDAWLVLERTFRETAWLHVRDIAGRRPHAIWAVIKPRGPVLDARGIQLAPGEQQVGVVVNYLVAGRVATGGTLSEGLWTAEIPVHALGRALQRDPTASLDALVLELHRRLLAASTAGIDSYVSGGMVVKAGRGAFLCSCYPPILNVSTGRPSLLVRANTWLLFEQLRGEQRHQATRLDSVTGEPTLGMSWFRPDPLRFALGGDPASGIREELAG